MILKYRRDQKVNPWGIIYFVLLIPSVFLLPGFDREEIAFNLAGPFALAMAVTFFSDYPIYKRNIKNSLLAFVGPSVGLGFLAFLGIVSTSSLVFTTSSLRATSAGIGPNQVSSSLGLGVVSAFFLLVLTWEKRFLRFIFLGIFLWLLIQNSLTFSRGGVWTALITILVVVYYLFREKRARRVFIGVSIPFLLVIYFSIFPALDNFTNNTFSSRYSDFDLTGREAIMAGDMLAFMENPLFGVGPGQSKSFHSITHRYSNSHTEYTRLLAEHGLFGVAAIMILGIISLQRVFSNGSSYQKMFRVAFTVWVLFYLFHSSTRTVAPSLLFGMGAAMYLDE